MHIYIYICVFVYITEVTVMTSVLASPVSPRLNLCVHVRICCEFTQGRSFNHSDNPTPVSLSQHVQEKTHVTNERGLKSMYSHTNVTPPTHTHKHPHTRTHPLFF